MDAQDFKAWANEQNTRYLTMSPNEFEASQGTEIISHSNFSDPEKLESYKNRVEFYKELGITKSKSILGNLNSTKGGYRGYVERLVHLIGLERLEKLYDLSPKIIGDDEKYSTEELSEINMIRLEMLANKIKVKNGIKPRKEQLNEEISVL